MKKHLKAVSWGRPGRTIATLFFATMSFIYPTFAASPVGDVVGKLTVGYQGWFAASGDGSPRNKWIHWGGNNTTPPAPGQLKFELWPDCREYSSTYQTGFANLGNGQPAKLFSSWPDQVVDTHVQWMQTYGIDTIAIQRFGGGVSDPPVKAQMDGIASKVRNASQTFGRKFYVMYDISGWTNFQSEIKTDWTNTIKGSLGLTASGAYAKQNGKPVVCIWGLGVSGRPGDNASWTDVINWFKAQGCYVIIGVPSDWRTNAMGAYFQANMISPWIVGGFSYAGADGYSNVMYNDQVVCESNSIDYQPVVWPGFAWSNWNGGARNAFPRLHGDFMWRQFANVRNRSIPSVYVAMFDEFDEGTAIAKAAEDSSMIPTNQYFLTLDADGVACSSDFYLRLAGDGAKMIKGQTPLAWSHPTTHQDVTIQTGGSDRIVQGQNYRAVVASDGMLTSFKVGTQEFLTSSTGLPRGLYLYQSALVPLTVTQPSPKVIVAQGAKGKLTYTFTAYAATITATNSTSQNMSYYGALDSSANTVFVNNGTAYKTIVNLTGQNTTTWFNGSSKLKIEGGSSLWGPWGNNLQIWEASLAANTTRTIALTAGIASAEELAKVASATPQP